MTAHDPLSEPIDAWLERRAAGRSTPADDSADADFASLRGVAGQLHDLAAREDARLLADSPPPPWEDVMHAHEAQSNRFVAFTDQSHFPVVPSLRGISFGPARELKAVRAILRWQAAVSLALVVAFLVGLVGIAWQRGLWNGSGNEPTPFGMVVASPEATSVYGTACQPQEGQRKTDDELRTMAYDDWPQATYGVGVPGWSDEGEKATTTYLEFLACYFAQPDRATAGPSEDEMSYYSDRLRFVLMYDALDPEQQAGIDAGLDRNPTRQLVQDGPLPINRSLFLEPVAGQLNQDYFAAFETFTLPDSRTGAFVGSVSTHMLQTGEPIRRGDGQVVFVAFAQQGDQFFIDELFMICPSAFAPGMTDRDNPFDAIPHDPAQLLRGAGDVCA